MDKIIIDAEGIPRGRIASYVAKIALGGKEVAIINSEKAIISGADKSNISDFKRLRALNTIKPEKGPFFSKSTEKIMKRTIRGMLPDFRRGKGKEAWRRIKCYNGIPGEFKHEKAIKPELHKPEKFITIKELSDRA